MEAFRRALLLPGASDVRASILDDLATHFAMPVDECIDRCINWEEWSAREWEAAPREDAPGIAEFYRTTHATGFDVLWYAYLQAERYLYPVSVAVARTLRPHASGARHLDFGSGCGATSGLFIELGYDSTLADISTSLLRFARFRVERRGRRARFLDLNSDRLPEAAFDVITAIDVLAQVPDLDTTVRGLHAALKPGGLLFTNFDTRPMSRENAWHLYSDDLPLRYRLHRAGFEPEYSLDGMITRYRRVEPAGIRHAARGVRDTLLLRSPARTAVRFARARARALTTGGRAPAS